MKKICNECHMKNCETRESIEEECPYLIATPSQERSTVTSSILLFESGRFYKTVYETIDNCIMGQCKTDVTDEVISTIFHNILPLLKAKIREYVN